MNATALSPSKINNEADFWVYLRQRFIAVVQRHEDKYCTGIPDLSFATRHHGWIELKYIRRIPKSKILLIPHYTPEQKNWLWTHGQQAGHCWLFVHVQETNEFWLFDHIAAQKVGSISAEECRDCAHRIWYGTIPPAFTDLV